MTILIFYLISVIHPTYGQAEEFPHPGVRYIWENTPILNSKGGKTGESLNPGDAVVPCVIIENGRPLTGEKGQVLVGFTKVFSEPSMPKYNSSNLVSIVEAHQKLLEARSPRHERLVQARRKYNLNKFGSIKCGKKIDGVAPMAKFYPTEFIAKYPPAPTVNTDLVKALENFEELRAKDKDCECETLPSGEDSNIVKLVKEFHNSKMCLGAELNAEHRVKEFKKAWKDFKKQKLAEDGGKTKDLKEKLDKAQHTDVGARTAIWEGDHSQGCTGDGVCERDLILLSLRNRGEKCGLRKDYGCRKKTIFQHWEQFKVSTIFGVIYMPVERI